MTARVFCASCGRVMPIVWARTFSDMDPEHVCTPCLNHWRAQVAALLCRPSQPTEQPPIGG